ncbi:MAG: hypothetical protein K2G56_00470 [Eubacterium sp.]|nr:hypothetical protein [Eubacterium sp.]
MKPEDLKNSMNSIEPNSYMETRLFAEIKDAEKPKKKSKRLFKAAVCTALCCAVLVAGVGIGIPKKVISDSDTNVVQTENTNNYFVMSVYAAESDKKTATPIDDKAVTLPDFKLKKEFGSDGLELRGSSENSGIRISGENIKAVKFKCQTGPLDVWDLDMSEYLRENGKHYDIIVPCSDEYKFHMPDEKLDIMFKHIKNGDYDEYIKDTKIGSRKDYEGVDVVYDEDGNEIGIGLVSKETYYKIFPGSALDEWWTLKEYTFQNVLNKTEGIAEGVSLDVFSYNAQILFDNPDLSFSELPHDTLSIEVIFNDGSVQNASYDFSFNDNGELVVQRIAN